MLITFFIVSMLINLIMFIPAYFFRTDKLTDISYALTFVTCITYGFISSEKTAIQSILLAMILAWAFRLGSFLLYRIQQFKKDSRFDEMRSKLLSFLGFWLLQGLTVFILLIPTALLFNGNDQLVFSLSFVGVLIFALGLAIESIADYQKMKFKKSGASLWIDTGIWRISRHPNYLGEIMIWIGVYILVLPYASTFEALVSLASPLFIIILLNFVSGVPLLEKSADKKWSKDSNYKKYKSEVPKLIPSIKSIGRIVS